MEEKDGIRIVLKEFYSNGNPKFLYEEDEDDVEQLIVTTWYESGQKRKVVSYCHGNIDESVWFPNDQLMYKNEDFIDPYSKYTYQEWNQKGQLISEYYRGDVLDIGYESESKQYYSNGQLSHHSRQCCLDHDSGECQKEWYKNGQLKSKGSFLDIECQRWFSNGQLQYMSFRKKNTVIRRSWYSNNRIKSYQEFTYDPQGGSYSRGGYTKKVGIHRFCDKDGNIISQKRYPNEYWNDKEDITELNDNI